MSSDNQRPQSLLEQARPAEAERDALKALTLAPNDPEAHSMLALSRVALRRPAEALRPAQTAIGLVPTNSHYHFVHALVLHELGESRQAREAVDHAIKLDPTSEDNYALLSSMCLAYNKPLDALAAADSAIELNPQSARAANLRSMALVRLGRKEEATETIDEALERDPRVAMSHANKGWDLLHRNEFRAAQVYLREALRLDPSLEYARDGMLGVMKAKYPPYRTMLTTLMWLGRMNQIIQWGYILLTFLGLRFVREAASAHPEWEGFLWLLLVLGYVIVYLSWAAGPVFNLFLRLDPYGTAVLSPDDSRASEWFGVTGAIAVVGLLLWARGFEPLGYSLASVFGVLSICLAATYSRFGRARIVLAVANGAMAVLGVAAIVFMVRHSPLGPTLLVAYAYAFVAYQVLAHFAR